MHQKHHSSLQKEIYKTLAYSDCFDYPLTGDQVYRYLGKRVTRKRFLHALAQVPHVIVGNTIYYYLPKREKIVLARLAKEKFSTKQLLIAKRVARMLSLLPTILFVGISGSLAMKNADKKSDIDLFFITTPHSLWITRILVYVSLQVMGMRRKKYGVHGVCANMFIDSSKMRLPVKKRTLYGAREIMQVYPLINKQSTFEKFLKANSWVKNYFPNVLFPKEKKQKTHVPFPFIQLVEHMCMKLQLWYMKKDKTTEITTPTLIAFHPVDYEGRILNEYEKRLKHFAI